MKKKDLEELLRECMVFRTFLQNPNITSEHRDLYEKHYTFRIRRIEEASPINYAFHAVWYDAYFLKRMGVQSYIKGELNAPN